VQHSSFLQHDNTVSRLCYYCPHNIWQTYGALIHRMDSMEWNGREQSSTKNKDFANFVVH
jgi:hypothetical protein